MKSEMLCNPEFCGLLKVSPDVYGVNGCAPGHACGEPPARANPEFTTARLITQFALAGAGANSTPFHQATCSSWACANVVSRQRPTETKLMVGANRMTLPRMGGQTLLPVSACRVTGLTVLRTGS